MGQVMYVCGKINNAPSISIDEPTSYNLISKYTESQTIVAPEDGYFQFEIHGHSGSGGAYVTMERNDDDHTGMVAIGGGGGQSGGYACSAVQMNKGDTAKITIGDTCTIEILSTKGEYEIMSVTKGADGTRGSYRWKSDWYWEDAELTEKTYYYWVELESVGQGGSGGAKATGGNVTNIDGKAGKNGTGQVNEGWNDTYQVGTGGNGGETVHAGGNAGGKGGTGKQNNYNTNGSVAPESGKPGFVYFYRGNTNVVAQEV